MSDPQNVAREQLRQVFQFLEQWHTQQIAIARDWRRHDWTLALSDLPDHAFVEIGGVDSGFLLRVRRPEPTPCPQPSDELLPWLQPGWREPGDRAAIRPARTQSVAAGTLITRFDEDEFRPELFHEWSVQREAWRAFELPVRQAAALFERLFALRGRLE